MQPQGGNGKFGPRGFNGACQLVGLLFKVVIFLLFCLLHARHHERNTGSNSNHDDQSRQEQASATVLGDCHKVGIAANKWIANRLWHPVMTFMEGGAPEALDTAALNDAQKDLRRLTHETLAKCEDDYGRRLAFNTVVAAVMSLMNQVLKFEDDSPQGRAVVYEALQGNMGGVLHALALQTSAPPEA